MNGGAKPPAGPSYLLDIAPLLALLWETHEHHQRTTLWQEQANLTICPLTELGFLRISTQPTFGATFAQAKKMLRDWKKARQPGFIPCDLSALDMDDPPTRKRTTDF